jgi:hypothetical protein
LDAAGSFLRPPALSLGLGFNSDTRGVSVHTGTRHRHAVQESGARGQVLRLGGRYSDIGGFVSPLVFLCPPLVFDHYAHRGGALTIVACPTCIVIRRLRLVLQ